MTNLPPRFPAQSRYAKVAGYSRRSFLGIGLGALATLVGCGSSDDGPFSGGNLPREGDGAATVPAGPSTSVPTETSAGRSAVTLEVQVDGQATVTSAVGDVTTTTSTSTTSSQSSSTNQPTTTRRDVTTTRPATTTEAVTTTSTTARTSTTTTGPTTTTTQSTLAPTGALPPGTDLAIVFTYQEQGGGRILPPYIAVWIEDDGGSLVDTVALWYQQFDRGETWLPDLRRWYSVSGGSSTTDSGPTRAPGQHQVAWGGRSASGQPMPAGRYFVCVEAARELGPYSLVRTAVDLNGSSVNIELGSDRELQAVSARTA